jgi:hypothetical protein
LTDTTTTGPVDQSGFDRNEVNAKLIAGLGLAIIVGLVALIVAIQHYYDENYEQQIYQKVLEPVAADLKDLRAREDQQLYSYEYIDREKGTVRLTIERAMELLVAESANGRLPYPTAPYPAAPEGGVSAAQ